MTTSNFMPDVVVEIAFDSGYSTPAASRTWTDVSEWVELKDQIKIVRGRQDEMSTAEASKVDLVLDNSDGRFTPERPSSPYYPDVKIGRPIRITSTPIGGSASVRFVGYVDEWPVEWDGTDAYAFSKITARSRKARLGFDYPMMSIVEEECLLDEPIAYYTMGDPEGSLTAADSSASTPGPLATLGSGAGITFGSAIGPPTDGLTGATLAGGKYLRNATPIAGAQTLEAWFIVGSPPSDAATVASIRDGSSETPFLAIGIDGKLAGGQREPGLYDAVTTASSVCDGNLHHAVVVIDSTADLVRLYLDGVSVGTNAIVDYVGGSGQMNVGYSFDETDSSTFVLTGSVFHVAAYSSMLSGARALDHYGAGVTGHAGDAASTRIGRYAAFAGVPAIEFAGDADTNPIDDIDTTGKTAVEVMGDVETTEGGVLFDGKDNTLTFHGRARRYNRASDFTLTATAQQIEDGLAPKLDRSTLANDITATASDGSTARAVNQTSVDDYGVSRSTVELAAPFSAAQDAANWQVNLYGTPAVRISSLGCNILPLSSADKTLIFAADVGTRFTAAGLPSQASATSIDFFIEGYTETIGPESYEFDFNLSPVDGYDVFTLDNATRGLLDGPYPIAY